jgi:hypothetical protein
MGLFSAIMDKLRGRSTTNAPAAQQPTATAAAPSATSAASPSSAAGPSSSAATAPSAAAAPQQATPAALRDVDVGAVLADLAKQKGGGGNYQTSIVDLLKLLDLDSSLAARTELAEELNVRAGAHGSAEQNIALHKAVMRKIAENGGKVPESMRS